MANRTQRPDDAAASGGMVARDSGGRSDPPSAGASPVLDDEIVEMTCGELQASLTAGARSAVALVDTYLRRIAALNRVGPELGAVIELNPDAVSIAAALDEERRRGRVRGPLHGIPILLKDNIDTADRMTTTAGSLALEGVVAARDATVAAHLRAAGAVLLGKANMSEWANFRSNVSTSGWSARGGQCRNPYVLDRSPSGSSSGSAVGVAANLVAAAVGTETDGSIVSPASHCAVVGVKPTLGLVSRAGIVPIAHSQDTAGPLARTVRDAALLLQVMAGGDARDPASLEAAAKGPFDFVSGLAAGTEALRGVRLGVMRSGLSGQSSKVDAVFETALDDLRRMGATIVDPADVPTWEQLSGDELDVLLYEFKHDLEAYLGALGPRTRVKTLADVIAFNLEHADQELQHFGQELFVMAAAQGPLTESTYRRARERNRQLAGPDGIDMALRTHRVDALVGPTGSLPGVIDLVNGDRGYFGASTPAAVAGYPHVTVPAGFIQGLPVGLSFVGTAWSDATLLRLAHAFEQGTRHRRVPGFAPSVPAVLERARAGG